MEKIDDLKIGIAGEHLVCTDLIMKGYDAFLSDQGLPYDVVAEINKKLIKIQVKTTRTHCPILQRATTIPAYIYHIKRCGKKGKKRLTSFDVDLFSLVCLDTRQVGYIISSHIHSSVFIRVDKFRGTYPNEMQQIRFDNMHKLKESGLTNTQISKETSTNKSVVGRILSGKANKRIVGQYFDDIPLEKLLHLWRLSL